MKNDVAEPINNTQSNDPVLLSSLDYNNPVERFSVDTLIKNKTNQIQNKSFINGLEYLYFVTRTHDENGIEVRPEEPIEGSKDEVWGIRPTTRGRFSRKPIEYLGTLHSHHDTAPPSFTDISSIINGNDIFAIVTTQDITYCFVSTDATKRINTYDWNTDTLNGYNQYILSDKQNNSESKEEYVDRKTLEFTLQLCKKHNILVYTSTNQKDYQIKEI